MRIVIEYNDENLNLFKLLSLVLKTLKNQLTTVKSYKKTYDIKIRSKELKTGITTYIKLIKNSKNV